jgi:hypothetical protein
MPGFIGGSTSGSGTGGEITFPKEFVDPVTKLRVSTPETLIDTDFEYGLQPTKWETVELINNTPSFFSKGGDTTIPNITSITTNAGTREITVNTLTDHNLSVGIPINVTGTKSVTADGSYIIASIPTTTSFTYLCKDNQATTQSIEDLYTSIITGEFFQGSQIRVSDSAGIITDGASVSTLTVSTDSAHGFKVDTPFYFLNLNSTISQEFQAANTTAKSFDSSNSATAQTFDGSNTLSSINVDWSNSANAGGTTSSIASVVTATDVITVTHTTENFIGSLVGTPLYYNVTSASGYFSTNPRGVVFLKSLISSSTSSSSFTVSDLPDGNVIDITASMTGTFQLANQARTFAGNNINPATQQTITILKSTPVVFDGANDRTTFSGIVQTTKAGTITGGTGTLQFTPDSGLANLDFYVGSMVQYTTTGSAMTGLTANETYFISDVFLASGTSYRLTLSATPGGAVLSTINGGTGTQKLSAIGVSITRDIIHAKNNGFAVGDMIRYEYPSGGRFGATAVAGEEVNHYFVETVYDSHNFTVTNQLAQKAVVSFASSVANSHNVAGQNYTSYTMDAAGSGSVVFSRNGFINLLVVGGGGGGGTGGGGAGGLVYIDQFAVTAGTTYSFTVGDKGLASIVTYNGASASGGNSTFSGGGLTITANGGGPSGHSNEGGPGAGNLSRLNGGSGGGSGSDASGYGVATQTASFGSYTNVGFGNNGGQGYYQGWTGGGGGGGAGASGGVPLTQQTNNGRGGSAGVGRQYALRTGSNEYYAGGGAGGNNTDTSITQVAGGLGGGGASNTSAYGGTTGVNGTGPDTTGNGLSATFYGGGGGGGDHQGSGGNGYRGVVIFRHTV